MPHYNPPNAGNSGPRTPDYIPRTGSGVFRMVKSGAIGYRASDYVSGPKRSYPPQSIFPSPTNSDTNLVSSYSGSNSSSGSQRTRVADGSSSGLDKVFSGLAVSAVPRTPLRRARVPSSSRPRKISTSTNQHWVPAGNQLSDPSASPQSAKRAQSGSSDMVGGLLGKYPSAAVSDGLDLDRPVKIVYRKAKGDGKQGLTYVAHLTRLQDAPYGVPVFVKEMEKRYCLTYNSHSEVRANERLIGADTGSHSNGGFIARIHAFVDSPPPYDRYIFVYELHLCDLSAILKRPKSSDYQVTKHRVLWIAQIAAGIDYLHSVGIIHRDIKPDNVLLSPEMNMRLTDLGLAYVSKSKAPLAANGLYCYLACGTPFYAAPEMIRLSEVNPQVRMGWKHADPDETEGRHVFYGPKLDWYSFGVVLYEMAATFFQDPNARKAKRFVLTYDDKEALLGAWQETMDHRRGLVSMTAWGKFMQTHWIPDELWNLLWILLHEVPEQRGDFRAIYKNAFFIEKGKCVFDGLAQTSFDPAKRPTRDYPDKLMDKDYKDVEPLIISHTHSDGVLNQRTKSWIDPSSLLFNCVDEVDYHVAQRAANDPYYNEFNDY